MTLGKVGQLRYDRSVSDPAKITRAALADLLAIPEEQRRHELIDGVLVEKEAASGRHGGAQFSLGQILSPYRRKPGGRWPGGWWFATETEIMLSPTQVYRPDVTGWRRERLPELPAEVPIKVAPDWICEILSTNRRNDLIKKKRAYHQHQVGHYWVVDPVDETLAVYRWHADGYVEIMIAERAERVRAEPFDAIEIHVAVLFGEDEPEA